MQIKKIRVTYFKKAEFCVLNCGVTLLEALYMKKKCFVLPQNIYEKNFSNFLIKEKNIYSNDYNKLDFFLKKNLINSKNIKVSKQLDKLGTTRIKKIFEKEIL